MTLDWSASAPAPCTTSVLLNGAWVSSTGSQVFQPVADTTWSLQAYDPGGWISRTVSVAVDSPPPASKRTVTIPTDFIQLQINLVLFDTTVQLSFFDSDGVLSVPVVEEQCENHYDEDVDQCLAGCFDLPPKNQGECRDDCWASSEICYPVCSAKTGSSFLRWGNARQISKRPTGVRRHHLPRVCVRDRGAELAGHASGGDIFRIVDHGWAVHLRVHVLSQ